MITLGSIRSDPPERGSITVDWIPLEEGQGSTIAVDEFFIEEGYLRYWDGTCFFDGSYLLGYVNSDVRLDVRIASGGESVSVVHYFDVGDYVPPSNNGGQVAELPDCGFGTE